MIQQQVNDVNAITMTESHNVPTTFPFAAYPDPDRMRAFPGDRDQRACPADRNRLADARPRDRDAQSFYYAQSHARAAGPEF